MALEGVAMGSVDAAIISTVVPQTLFNLRRLSPQYFSVEPEVVALGAINLGPVPYTHLPLATLLLLLILRGGLFFY